MYSLIIYLINKYNSFILFDSKIINKNEEYINNIIKWINKGKKEITTELLYRKTDNGDSYNTFHQLCDNQGPTVILIKGNKGFIIGGYTPLSWDSNSGYKKDNETFLFSLTNNEIYTKCKEDIDSIYYSKNYGPHFHCLKFPEGNNMNKIELAYGCSNYKNLNKIIPSSGKSDVEEVEVYKITFI